MSLLASLDTVVGRGHVSLLANLETVVGRGHASLLANLDTVVGRGHASLLADSDTWRSKRVRDVGYRHTSRCGMSTCGGGGPLSQGVQRIGRHSECFTCTMWSNGLDTSQPDSNTTFSCGRTEGRSLGGRRSAMTCMAERALRAGRGGVTCSGREGWQSAGALRKPQTHSVAAQHAYGVHARGAAPLQRRVITPDESDDDIFSTAIQPP